MACNHDLSMLMGTADGIVCRGCGKLFKSFDEIHPQEAPAEAPAQEAPKPKPKRTSTKKKEGA